jgi:hypothetical protein
MNLKASTVIWVFLWCIFMGITVGSIGVGALFPSTNLIAAPFVCPGGTMQNTSQYYQVSPVESVTTITWYCVDGKTGAKTELGLFPMSLYAGAIYGLVFFLVVLLGMAILGQHKKNIEPRQEVLSAGIDDRELRELEMLDARERRASNKKRNS